MSSIHQHGYLHNRGHPNKGIGKSASNPPRSKCSASSEDLYVTSVTCKCSEKDLKWGTIMGNFQIVILTSRLLVETDGKIL